MVGSPRHYFMITDNIKEFYPEATWLAQSSGSQTFGIAAIAIATGAHMRVGFEDSPFFPNDPSPRSNAGYTDWAVAMAWQHGGEPATPAQTREILAGIPQIKPTFLDIAPSGIPSNIIPHSKGIKCGLIRSNSPFSYSNHRPAKPKIPKPLVYAQVSPLGTSFATP